MISGLAGYEDLSYTKVIVEEVCDMAACRLCGLSSKVVSARIGYCGSCITDHFSDVRADLEELHARLREPFGLPPSPPRDHGGLVCDRCLNVCRLAEGSVGYCGLRTNESGRLTGGDADTGRVSWYYDPLPTNCVSDWVCAGGTGRSGLHRPWTAW